jgi:signal transduction histidine kinase/streptogramin lyase
MRYFCLIILCLLCCFVFSATTIIAQQSLYFAERLTTNEGLGSNNVSDIAQDENGFLWIATSDGLNRFDGTEVVKYYHQPGSNSIPHNYVYCLETLPGNHLAIGTQAGLSFYNGNTGIFRNFYWQQNNGMDAYNNTIIGIKTDAKGNCWAWSKNCIFIFNPSLQLIKTIASPYTDTVPSRTRLTFVEKMFPLANGDMLLCMYDGWKIYSSIQQAMFSIDDPRYYIRFHFLKNKCYPSKNKERYMPATHVFQVYTDYFLCISQCADSILLFDQYGQEVAGSAFAYNKYPYILWSQQVSAIDSSNLLLSFHNYGITVIPVSWKNKKPILSQASSLLLESHEYGSVLRDRQGNWWLSTMEEGLQKISPQKQYFTTNILVDHHSGKPIRYDVTHLTRHDKVLWASTYGEGFFEADPVSGRQEQHRLTKYVDDEWADFIWNTRFISEDTLWVGTQAGMYWYTMQNHKVGRIPDYPGKPPALDSVPITSQFEDSRGFIWMGMGRGRGVCRFDPSYRRFAYYPYHLPGGYPYRYPVAIAEDLKGDLWFASDGSSNLVQWHRSTNQFVVVAFSPAIQQQAGGLSSLLCDKDSVIWVGTVTGGLIKFNPLSKVVIVYGHDRGLVNSHISSIYKDRSERLWLVTDGGLSCFDPRNEMFTNYTSAEGLPSKYASGNLFYDIVAKALYAGGQGMFYRFDPDGMNYHQPAQKTIITGMEVNGKSYLFESQMMRFSYRQNNITIHYTAIDLVNGPATKYAYQLLGEDTAWIMAGNLRQINFSRLAPGKYTFKVRAANNYGEWSNESASISFQVRPPFTKTAWFYGLILVTVVLVFHSMYRFRLRQLKRAEQIRSEISRNLHDEVGSTLTNISLGSLLAQKQLAQEGSVNHILDRIYQDSQHVSQTMREIVWSIDPHIDTLGEAFPRMLRYASELLEARNIEPEAVVEKGVEQIRLSMEERRDLYLIFKEAINNLARHSGATLARIHFELAGHTLLMTISDNGTGFDLSAGAMGNGLKNMEDRARLHHWKLTIESVMNKGTVLRLRLH